MIEDYVSIEVAKLLKEKGFDWSCQAFFGIYGEYIEFYELNCKHSFTDSNEALFAAPTLYMAQKWLRSRGYHVEVIYMQNDLWRYDILTIPRHDCVWLSETKPSDYTSYENALQEGILEALKLI